MAPTFKIFAFAIALLLSYSAFGYAQFVQYEQLPFVDQSNQVLIGQHEWVVGNGGYNQFTQPVTSSTYQYVATADAVNELYHRNAQKPLRGLFADGFTRTLTVLGGANFLNSIEANTNLLGSAGTGGELSTEIESDTGYAISFAFGRRHNHRLRSEIELALRGNDTSFEFAGSPIDDTLGIPFPANDEAEIRAYSIMKNFITEFQSNSRFTPYIGAGLGWSYIDLEAPSVDIDEGDGTFSYQAIGGVATTINNAADFIVEYRFFGTTEIDVDGIEDSVTYRAHNLFLGVKFEY